MPAVALVWAVGVPPVLTARNRWAVGAIYKYWAKISFTSVCSLSEISRRGTRLSSRWFWA